MLEALVTGFLLTVLLLAVLVVVLSVVFATHLRRRNRVEPDSESLAPITWLWSPATGPRLHRRLQGATVPLRHIDQLERDPAGPRRPIRRRPEPVPVTGSAADLRRSVRRQAVELDRAVVLNARLPRPQRRASLRAIGQQVSELERLSVRLVRLHQDTAADTRPPGAGPPLAEAAQHLAVLEQAHAEMRQIEQANGLADPDEILRRIEAPQVTGPRVPTSPDGTDYGGAR